jgi:AcrR family transcriptional regulator
VTTSNTIKEDLIQKQILQAAQQLFQKHGLHKVTMDDVAKAIGKGRSSLYYYYKSKDEVFDAVMDVEIKEIMADLTRAMNEVAGIEQKIRAFCITRLKIARKKKAFFSTMEVGMNADEISHYAKAKQAIRKRIIKEESALLNFILHEGIKKGEITNLNSKDQETLVFLLLSSLHGMKRQMLNENDFSRMESATDLLIQMVSQRISK